jgi:PilZ domain
MSEKRFFERAEFIGDAEIELRGQRLPARLRDLSVGGAYVVTTAVVPVHDEEVVVRIVLPAIADKGLRSLGGTVRWIRADGFGVQFGPTGALDTYALAEYVARAKQHI